MEYSITGRANSATTSRMMWMLSASSTRRWVKVIRSTETDGEARVLPYTGLMEYPYLIATVMLLLGAPLITAVTGTALPLGAVCGICTSICQIPTNPGVRPEN